MYWIFFIKTINPTNIDEKSTRKNFSFFK